MRKSLKKRRISTSKMKKGSLIKYPLENVKRSSFEVIRKELKEILHKQPGVYALYDKERLVYVGLAIGLYGRVHGWSKHKRIKWDNFSIFIVKNIKYLRDLETAVVRIAKPKGNKIEGRVPPLYEHYLKRILKEKVNRKRHYLKEKVIRKDKEIRSLRDEVSQMEEAIYSRP